MALPRQSLSPKPANPFLPVPRPRQSKPKTREEKDHLNLINRRRKRVESAFRKLHQLYTNNECDVYCYLKPRDEEKALVYNTEPYAEFPVPYESIKIRYPRTEINTPARPKHMLRRALGMDPDDDGPAPGWRGPTLVSAAVTPPDPHKPLMFVRDLQGSQPGPSMSAPRPAGSSSSMFPFLRTFPLSHPSPMSASTDQRCSPGPPASGTEATTSSSSDLLFLSTTSSPSQVGGPMSPTQRVPQIEHAVTQLDGPVRDDDIADADPQAGGGPIQPSRKRHSPISFHIPIKAKRPRGASQAQRSTVMPRTPSPSNTHVPATPEAPRPRRVGSRTEVPLAAPIPCLVHSHTGTRMQLRDTTGKFVRQG